MFLLMLYLICIIVQLNHIFIIVVLFGATASGVGLSEKLQKIKNRAAPILLHASNEDDIDKLF